MDRGEDELGLRPAGADLAVAPLDERHQAGAVLALARAFRDNPLNRAVLRAADSRRRERSNAAGTRPLVASARRFGEAFVALHRTAVAGALIGAPPYGYPLPPPPLADCLRSVLAQGVGVTWRWMEVFRALDALHPREPHRYLGTLGVDPAAQRLGVGTALLRHFVARADAEGVAVYLETDRSETTRFYAREGFEVVREARVIDVPVWCMWRPARAPSPGAARSGPA